GEGVERSDVEAYKWFNIAAELGVVNAGRHRERVARELNPEQRLQAGKLSDEWLSKFRINSA
ncbi:MAG: sel1 repeat family protein, partial [Thiolinea sp.]